LFVKKSRNSFTALLVYVDDKVLTGNILDEITHVKTYLHAQFCIKELRPLKFFLGIEVAHSTKGINLNQRKYCLELLIEHNLLDCQHVSTLIDASVKVHVNEGLPLEDATSYRCLMGRLIYLTNTRPDISYAVQTLSQFVESPRVLHFQAALKSSPALSLFYSSQNEHRIHYTSFFRF
jgi:hypothetical protein